MTPWDHLKRIESFVESVKTLLGPTVGTVEADESIVILKRVFPAEPHTEIREVPERPVVLTEREKSVLQRIMQGKPNKMIAQELDCSEATVKVFVKAVLRKLGVNNRTQAALKGGAYL